MVGKGERKKSKKTRRVSGKTGKATTNPLSLNHVWYNVEKNYQKKVAHGIV